MFKPLGLFNAPCPDPQCRRPTCFFVHGESSKASTASKPKSRTDSQSRASQSPVKRTSVTPSTRDSATPITSTPAKRPAPTTAGSSRGSAESVRLRAESTEVKRPRVEEKGEGTPAALLASSRSGAVPAKAVDRQTVSDVFDKAYFRPKPRRRGLLHRPQLSIQLHLLLCRLL